MKITFVDIETFPARGYFWGMKWETSILRETEHVRLAMFAYKRLGETATYAVGLNEVKSQKALVRALWKVFHEADILVAHNGKAFDFRQSNAFFIQHGLPPPSNYAVIDTKQVAKRYFKFSSNSLDDLGDFLGVGRKESTGGIQLWWDCMDNKPAAWAKMRKYNKQDVLLLEKVYLKLRPWMTNHPNANVFNDTKMCCPNCTSARVVKDGPRRTRTGVMQEYRCLDCGAYSRAPVINSHVILR